MTGMNDAQEAILLAMAVGAVLFLIGLAVIKLHDLAERRRHRAGLAQLVVHLDSMSPETLLGVRGKFS